MCAEFDEAFLRHKKFYFELISMMNQFIIVYNRENQLLNEYLAEFNVAPAFFDLTFRTHRTCMILWILKLFDPDERPSSLYSFLEFLSQNARYLSVAHKMRRTNADETTYFIRNSQDVNPGEIASLKAQLDELQTVVLILKTLRDKYHAHADRSFINNRQSFLEKNSFSMGQLEPFSKVAIGIFNFACLAFNGDLLHTTPINCDDLAQLLRTVRMGMVQRPAPLS